MAALQMSSLCLSCVRRLNLLKITSSYSTGSSLCRTNLRTFRHTRTQNRNALFSTSSVHTCNVHEGIKDNKMTDVKELEQKQTTASNHRLSHGRIQPQQQPEQQQQQPDQQPEQRLSHGGIQLQQQQRQQQQEVADYKDYLYSDRERRDRGDAEGGAVDYTYFKRVIAAARKVDAKPYRASVPIDAKLLQDVEEEERQREQYEEDVRHVRDSKKMGSKHKQIDSGATQTEQCGSITEQSVREIGVTLTSSDAGSSEETFGVSMTDAGPELKPRARRKKVRGLQYVKPKLPTKSNTLVPYVNESVVLKNLLSLGVELPKVEKDAKASNFLLTCDWERDIQPYLVFLHQLGVKDEHLGRIFSKFPSIFLTDIDVLKERVQYLLDKRFPDFEIPYLIKRTPTIISVSVKDLDANLGYIQKEFKLRGAEVRQAVLRHPKIAIYDKRLVQMVKDHFEQILEFSDSDIKNIMIQAPRVYCENIKATQYTFEYLVNEMGMTHADIAQEPYLMLRTRHVRLKPRHSFLKHLHRAQYDPTKENYVSFKSLVSGTDFEFVKNVAKVPVQVFRDYLKTM